VLKRIEYTPELNALFIPGLLKENQKIDSVFLII